MMKAVDTRIPDLKLLEPTCFSDARGWFMESWNQLSFDSLVAERRFLQDNHSVSRKGVLRGLHYQTFPKAQGKLVRVTKGAAFDVAVDIRPGSKTYGEHFSVILSEENQKMLWIPEGFCHGFLALEDYTHFHYKTTEVYDSQCERSYKWDSPSLGISWPDIGDFILSEKDRSAPNFP
jgi:dTDP-4-dehydrorhamnose 3,5-epimerase